MTDSPVDHQLQRHEVTVMEALAADAVERDPAALLPAVYNQLRRLAQLELARMRPGQTLQATALVHDAWIRIVRGGRDAAGQPRDIRFNSRAHFFGAAVRAMRRILVEQARAKLAQKRGGGALPSPHDPQSLPGDVDTPVEDVLSLDDALQELEVHHERAAQVVQLRFFGGLEQEEIAGLLSVSLGTVERDWRFARSWLQRRLRQTEPGEP